MKLSKKILSIFFLVLFVFVIAACNGDDTVSATTEDTQTTTEESTEPSETGEGPQFVGLFTKQSYYTGSRDYDILEGVTVVDEEDGEISIDEVEVVGSYSLSRPGSYNVYAVVEDSDGNINNKQITIVVKDLSSYSIPETLTDDDIEIDLWHSNGATIETALMRYAADFQNLYPNITVNIIQNGNNYDELRQNVVNAIRGGVIPNIVQNYPDHVMEYIDNNAVIPLTPFIYHPTHGYNPDVEDESFLDIVLSYRRENSQYTTDGEYYSVPFNKSTEVMIYNKTMMDALIAEGTISEVPTTWQGLFEIADDLRRVAIDEGIIDQIATNLTYATNITLHKDAEDIQNIKDRFVPIAYDSPANAFITLTRQWGGQYTSINAQREGVILFDNPQTREMLSYFYDNRDDGETPGAFTVPGRWGTEYASDSFKIGQTAVTFGSTGGARYNTPDVVSGLWDATEWDVYPNDTFDHIGSHEETSASDLFISEYGAGSGDNKWIEIYNGTGSEVDLTPYSVELYSNGSSTATNTLDLTGTLADEDVLVIYNSGADQTIISAGDVSSNVTDFDGNDALALFKEDNLVDMIGVIGQDPGTSWEVSSGATADFTLVRNKVDGNYVFDFGVAPMPYNEDMPENRTAIQQGTNMSVTTAGTDQEKLASWLFLKYLTSYEVQLDFALVTGYSPVRNTVYSDSAYTQFTNGLNSEGELLGGEMLMKSQAAQAAALQAAVLFYDQAFIGSSAARDAVEDAFGRVILGTDGTKQEIIDNAIAAAKSEAELVLGN